MQASLCLASPCLKVEEAMTTYSSDVSLTEQELWALEAAIDFYLHPKSKQLRDDNPELINWFLAAESVLMKMHETQRLREGLQMSSTYSGLWRRS